MSCYIKNCVNNNEWQCQYCGDCNDCSRGCKNYYKCSSCEFYMDESIEEEFSKEDKILFPFQYLEEYFYWKCSFNDACARTLDEVDRLIEEYIKNHQQDKP